MDVSLPETLTPFVTAKAREAGCRSAGEYLTRLVLREMAGGDAGRPPAPRRPGSMRGEIWVSPEFDRPLPEAVLAAFRGEGD